MVCLARVMYKHKIPKINEIKIYKLLYFIIV